jgi:thiopurine S-methyltransferase
MDHDFWRRRWEKTEIAFHEGVPNAFLTAHLARLALPKSARLFLPLCGKTQDIHWLLAQGFRVAGAELSAIAVDQLFADLGVVPTRTHHDGFTRCAAPAIGLDIFQGDLFRLDHRALGPVDAVYDRAALVALPPAMRPAYAAHIVALTRAAPQLLVTYEYDQQKMDGPPFSVPHEEVLRHYANTYAVSRLETREVADGLKGKCAATESACLLTPQ